MVLDLLSGRYADAALHLREALQTAMRTGVRRKALEDLDCCGYLCAWTGRPAEAVTVWAAVVALGREGFSAPLHPDLPEGWFQRQEPLREARQALGPAQTQAAEERGEALREACHRIHLALQDMSYGARRTVEVQAPWSVDEQWHRS